MNKYEERQSAFKRLYMLTRSFYRPYTLWNDKLFYQLFVNCLSRFINVQILTSLRTRILVGGVTILKFIMYTIWGWLHSYITFCSMIDLEEKIFKHFSIHFYVKLWKRLGPQFWSRVTISTKKNLLFIYKLLCECLIFWWRCSEEDDLSYIFLC